MMKELTDAELIARLTAYLAEFSEGQRPIVPLFMNTDGVIDREKTLALPCYGEFAALSPTKNQIS